MDAISEIKILPNVRLLNQAMSEPLLSQDNLRVEFQIGGEIIGKITCYLCLDGHELSQTEKNFIFPLFVESMNILIGKQISYDKSLKNFKINLSPPKISMLPSSLKTHESKNIQSYNLELDGISFKILSDYQLGVIGQ
jgi:hypothetical protein